MSVDQFIKWSFIAAVAVIDLILLNFCKIELQWTDLIVPAVGGTLLLFLSLYYHRHEGESLVVCMVTLLQVGCFTTAVSLLMYQTTMFNFPLNDHWLQAIDAWFGYSPTRFVNFIRSMPQVDFWLSWAYLFIVPQTMIAILAVAFSNQRRRLERFVTQFMVGTFLCTVIAAFWPAASPLYSQGFAPADWQESFISHFNALRSGDPFVFSWKKTEGLVTFPSFHTAWAIFLIVVWREHTRWVFLPMAVINVLIVLSTLTTGAHYLFDVFGGCALAGGCIWLSERVSAVSYHADGAPKRIPWLSSFYPHFSAPLSPASARSSVRR